MDISSVPSIGSRSKLSLEEDFLRTYPKKTLEQLHGTFEDGVFVVYATIGGLVENEDWWYPACKCHRSVYADSGAFYCNGCAKHVFQMIPRYWFLLFIYIPVFVDPKVSILLVVNILHQRFYYFASLFALGCSI